MGSDDVSAAEIVAFWREAGSKLWFRKSPPFDQVIRDRFEGAHLSAAQGAYGAWEETAEGALALVLLTDQFPRNLYRGSARAFASDVIARGVAGRALARAFDREVEGPLRPFFYLPFRHHEDAGSQARSMELFRSHAEATGDTASLRHAEMNLELINRFGRFPHRNAVLGRITSAEERAYLENGGFKG
ncbi:MAG: DUF924 family protein [Caulobacteraceae bacterium]